MIGFKIGKSAKNPTGIFVFFYVSAYSGVFIQPRWTGCMICRAAIQKMKRIRRTAKVFLGGPEKKTAKGIKKLRRHSAGIEQNIKTLGVSLSLCLCLSVCMVMD